MSHSLAFKEKYRSWLVMSGVMSLIMLINIDYTAVNLAFLPISKDMGVEMNTLQWLLSGYTLSWSAFVLAGGKLADIFGKRRLYLIGVALFGLASMLCGVATSVEMLIFGRVLQGFSGALFVAPIYTLVFSVFPENKQGMAIGILGAMAGVGLAIGPTLGGAIVDLWHWRWIFFINVPLCALSIFLVLWCVDKEPKRLSDERFDYVGGLLIALTLIVGMFALNQTEIWGVDSPKLWSLVGLAFVLLFLFLKISRGKDNALIPLGLFKNKAYLGCFIGFSVFEYVFSSILVVFALYLQNIKGYSTYESGLIFLALTIGLGGLSPFGGKLTDMFDPRLPICLGLLLVGGACMAAAFLDGGSSLYFIVAILGCIGLGMGFCFPALNATMMRVVDAQILNTASGVFVMGCTFGCSLGVVGSTSLLVGLGQEFLVESLGGHMFDVSIDQLKALMHFLASAHRDMASLDVFAIDARDTILSLVNVSFVEAMRYTMLFCAGVSILSAWYGYRTIVMQKK